MFSKNKIVGDSTLGVKAPFRQSFVNADLSTGILTVTHDLGQQYNTFEISDNNNDSIDPDKFTHTSITQSTIDLTTFGVLVGTWNLVIG